MVVLISRKSIVMSQFIFQNTDFLRTAAPGYFLGRRVSVLPHNELSFPCISPFVKISFTEK